MSRQGCSPRDVWRTGVLLLLSTVFCSHGALFAGTTGKLAGRVVDTRTQEPLISANVMIVDTKLGATTDLEGYYGIINIPPGKYRVRVSLVGYRDYIMQDIQVVADRTTKLDAALEEAIITAEAVVATAEKPVVDVNLTSTIATLSSGDIEALPVQELQDVVNLQAGVVDGHFRGGRIGEANYQLDGVTINNPYDNKSTLRIDRSLIQEVQVITGTFDAEYGQAMSGVVNTVLKSGTERFEWNAEVLAGDFLYPGDDQRGADYKFRPASLQNYQMSISGPTGLPQTYFLFSGRRYVFDDYLYGERRFVPTDRSDFENKVFYPTGDGKEVALGYSREWSGLGKLTNRSLSAIEIGYQVVFNVVEGRKKDNDFAFRFNPDGISKQKTTSFVHGLDWTHTLSASTFYNISLRQNYFDYSDYVYEDANDPRYDAAGATYSDLAYETGAIIQGVSFTRFVQKTNALLAKASVTSQVTRDHLLKLGAEFQTSKLEFGTPGHLRLVQLGGQQTLVRYFDKPPDFLPVQHYDPISLAAFAQDQVEWNDLTVRAGVRFEYFDARATIPSDLANPANSIEGAPAPSVPTAVKAKSSVAPRLGISYPISADASVFFSYGHFYQFPALGETFSNADYTVLKNLQAGGIDYGVLGNPDIKPERTVHYEFGYKHAITSTLGLNLNLFYKDIRDLLGVAFISTYTGAEYARLTNVDYGNVYGFTISLDQRRIGIVTATLDYTWQMGQGNSSDPRETATRAEAGEDPRPRNVPFDWDQRHTLNMTIGLSDPDQFSISTVLRYGSGQAFTPSIGSGFGSQIERNSGRKPNALVVDLRGEKYFSLFGANMSLFARVFNLLNTRFFNGFVFTDTGSADYTRDQAGQAAKLIDPTRFYPPRRIEVGISLNSSL